MAAHYARRFWDEYPSKTDLHLELIDRGLTGEQADRVLAAEDDRRHEMALPGQPEVDPPR